jgi:tetratricopeptide (TPR) repeat protein
MPGIFLSYRRLDSDYATLLYAWLTERFGPDQVFWDREDIDAGSDFGKVLRDRIRSAQAFVALIGPSWKPSVWIRRELGGALRRKAFVLPVLVGDVKHLAADRLHPSIRRLAKLESVETSDLRFRARFMEALERVVRAAPASPPSNDLRVGRLANLLLQQTDRLQEEALARITSGDMEQAESILNDVFALLMAMLDFHPGDTAIQVRLGYLFKDLAQTSGSDTGLHKRSVANGFKTFRALLDNERRLTRTTRADAFNGLGNMYLITGDYAQAIDCCRRAVDLAPDYTHAWGDLFAGYEGLAERGAIDLVSMTDVLRRLKATTRNGRAGRFYDSKALAALDERLQQWRKRAALRQQSIPARSRERSQARHEGR